MTLRKLPPAAAVALLTAAAVGGTALPAQAKTAGWQPGLVQLTMAKEGPFWGDDNNLVYDMHLTNAGPDVATGVVVRVTGWFCEGDAYSPSSCVPLPDRYDPARRMQYDIPLDSLAPHATASFPVSTMLPTEDAGYARTTVEVVRVDQHDTASVPGTCAEGWNPQPDCVSDVVPLY